MLPEGPAPRRQTPPSRQRRRRRGRTGYRDQVLTTEWPPATSAIAETHRTHSARSRAGTVAKREARASVVNGTFAPIAGCGPPEPTHDLFSRVFGIEREIQGIRDRGKNEPGCSQGIPQRGELLAVEGPELRAAPPVHLLPQVTGVIAEVRSNPLLQLLLV